MPDPALSTETPSSDDPALRSGYRTSEFWIAIIAALCGAFLIVVKGDVNQGSALLGTASLGYSLSRGIAKK